MLLQRQHRGGKCQHFLVKHTGLNPAQNFSHRFIEAAMVDGLVTIDGDKLTLKCKPEALRYTLKRTPGYYCVSTGERIPVSSTAWASSRRGELASREAREWLKAKGLPESDYEVTNAYECVLDEKQHAKYRAVIAPSGQPVAVCNLEG